MTGRQPIQRTQIHGDECDGSASSLLRLLQLELGFWHVPSSDPQTAHAPARTVWLLNDQMCSRDVHVTAYCNAITRAMLVVSMVAAPLRQQLCNGNPPDGKDSRDSRTPF